jgi:dienelactone hydrolase
MAHRDFAPETYYHHLMDAEPPSLAFNARTRDEWRAWRRRLLREVTRLVGGFPAAKCDLAPEVLEREPMDGYVREKVVFDAEPAATVVAYVLVPDPPPVKAPVVIALHGHGPGKSRPVGICATEEEREEVVGGERDYALQAVRRGYVAIAPDMRAFGERMNPADIAAGKEKSCRDAFLHGVMLGRTLVGERVWDVMRCIDYLAARPEADASRVTVMGQSGGGTVALFAAALERRIKAAVVSGYFCTFRDSIMSILHCECNYVPGLLRLAEMEDVAGLIAPRPLLIVAGRGDDIFPIGATERAFERLRRVYEVLGCAEKLEKYVGEGGHRFYAERVWPFLAKVARQAPRAHRRSQT